ncbi:MAG: D-alanyl-D-alanine carboxypeptidase DacD precursor [Alphaproteobacteria bacterium ADurb.Bin438]|nr:MAG: D-alanyl-D-alanine carboxypeptidase DacD precursor [Alphaproteobacteria bacterium ADurb.Bin438]
MALLAYSIMHNFPEHYHFFSEKKFFFNGKTYKSNNALVLYRKDVEGMKTGYVAKSGYHTITAIKKDGEKLIVVVMGRKNPRQRDQAAINTAYKGFNIVNSRKIKPLSEDKKEVFSLKKPLLSESAANLIAFSIRNANLIAQNIINAGNTRILAEKGDWSIQIGSFKSKKSAINAARVAKESIFAEGSEGASTIVIKRGKYYASFIKYLGKEDAESACEEIKANKKPCLVIAPK